MHKCLNAETNAAFLNIPELTPKTVYVANVIFSRD